MRRGAYHLDEHGRLRIEDIERQAIIERAGLECAAHSVPFVAGSARRGVGRVLDGLRDLAADPDDYDLDEEEDGALRAPLEPLQESGPKKKAR